MITILKKNLHSVILILTIFISFFLRTYNITKVPASLAPDEVALGYNAYSILQSGRDEHGKFLPLSFLSFGDGKLPLYIYLDAVSIAIFGLNEFSVKAPSILSGVVGTFLIFLIGNLLFKNKTIGLFSAFLYALSPWNIYFSRMAYEANLATTIFLGGIYFLLRYTQKNKVFFLVLSSILFSLTIFTYHSYVLFTPLFISGLVLFYRKNIRWDKSVTYAGSIFLLFLIIAYFSILKISFLKASNLGLYNNRDIVYNRVELLRGDKSSKNDIVERIIHNRYTGVSYQIIQNYLASFSPSFLFDKGGEKLLHNLGFFGNLYTIESLFLIAGIIFLCWNREKFIPMLVVWALLGPLPSAITEDAPNSVRLMPVMPLLTLISAYGFYSLLRYFNHTKSLRLFTGVICLLFAINVIYLIDAYFIHMNSHRARFFLYGFREAVFISQKYPNYNVVMRGPDNFPYVYFLFYNSTNSRDFIESVKYYPPTKEGFLYVKEFGRYKFVDSIDYSQVKPRTIYFDGTRLDDKNHSIFLPSGEPILGYYITQDL